MDSGKPKDKSGPVSKKKRLRKIPTSPSEINNFWTDHPAPELSKKQDTNMNDTNDMDDTSDTELYDIFFEDGDFNMEEKEKKRNKRK
ncbi:hypothetical protein Glove_346g75 [Diversispora epigaea]|uniref:Uncharacterized protein n=1 Tax=Diversispora epigaea TaxID=1348612 RepID=A0A397HFP4_9GLOM|nr:hypothetical protein Glove_346g75 [Diversispora epigaea]